MGIINKYTKMYWEVIRKNFINKIDKTNNGCWEWQGYRTENGYGLAHIPAVNKKEYAHRLSYELFNRPIEDGMIIMHTCDNPCCVNPDHLVQGTPKDNMTDKFQKGRHRVGKRPDFSGKKNPSVKISQETVDKIRIDYISGDYSFSSLAEKHGISRSQAFRIAKGHSWRA